MSKQTLVAVDNDTKSGLAWFSIPGASEPTLITDQEFVLYCRRIGLLECLSVMHFGNSGDDSSDDETAKKKSGGMFAVSVCEEFKL